MSHFLVNIVSAWLLFDRLRLLSQCLCFLAFHLRLVSHWEHWLCLYGFDLLLSRRSLISMQILVSCARGHRDGSWRLPDSPVHHRANTVQTGIIVQCRVIDGGRRSVRNHLFNHLSVRIGMWPGRCADPVGIESAYVCLINGQIFIYVDAIRYLLSDLLSLLVLFQEVRWALNGCCLHYLPLLEVRDIVLTSLERFLSILINGLNLDRWWLRRPKYPILVRLPIRDHLLKWSTIVEIAQPGLVRGLAHIMPHSFSSCSLLHKQVMNGSFLIVSSVP